jgi:hypothetical protein
MKTPVPPKYSRRASRLTLAAMGLCVHAALAAPADIVAFKVIQNKDTAALIKGDAGWVLARDGFPVNPSSIEAALQDLGTLASKSRPYPLKGVRKTASRAKEVQWTEASGKTFGIQVLEQLSASRFESDTSRWRHDTTATGHHELWIEGEDSTVWKYSGSSKTSLAEGTFGWVSARLLDWKDRALLPDFYPENIRSLSVDWVDASGKIVHYRLERDRTTGVRVIEPRLVPLSNRNAAQLYDRANQFAVDAFVPTDERDSANWGLDTPSMRLAITLWEGLTYTVTAGKARNEYRYVRHPHHPRPVLVLDARFAPLRKTLDQILAPIPPNADASEPIPGSEK